MTPADPEPKVKIDPITAIKDIIGRLKDAQKSNDYPGDDAARKAADSHIMALIPELGEHSPVISEVRRLWNNALAGRG